MAKKQATPKIELPANLSFMRSVEPTPGTMHAVKFEGPASLAAALAPSEKTKIVPVRVTATTIRGTISNDHKDSPEKRIGTGEKSLNAANIATVEQALLPADTEHLFVTYAVRFSGHSLYPSMCSSPSFRNALATLVKTYADKGGFNELAKRYVLNIVNGSWLWRNRFGQSVEVGITASGESVVFSEADIDMTGGFEFAAVLDATKRAFVERVVAQVAEALSGGKPVLLEVAGLVHMGKGAEVYPSQEFPSDVTEKVVKGKDADKVAKVLSKQVATSGDWVATIHPQKIGNALRTVDTWHGAEDVGAIAVEPYGANTHQGVVYRAKGNDLYTFLKKPDDLLNELDKEVSGKHHFVVACLVRGGVYGFAEASKSGTKEKAVEDISAEAEQE